MLPFQNISKHSCIEMFSESIKCIKPSVFETLYNFNWYSRSSDLVIDSADDFRYNKLKGKDWPTLSSLKNKKFFISEKIKKDKDAEKACQGIDGILLPGGFGSRGAEGKILTSKFARENNIPFLGICLGLQCAVIDYARNVCKIDDANSSEFKPKSKNKVIDLMESQRAIKLKGGTMRLGSYDCEISTGTKAYSVYRKKTISERHRHRYEVNNKYVSKMKKNGLIFSGMNKKLGVVEIIELKNHPWFVGCQFHPELKSRVDKAHPLFREFVKASLKNSKN